VTRMTAKYVVTAFQPAGYFCAARERISLVHRRRPDVQRNAQHDYVDRRDCLVDGRDSKQEFLKMSSYITPPAADMAQTTNHRAINFLLVLSLTRYRFFLSPKSSPTNFRTGSMSSYFAKLVSMYLLPSLGTCNSRNSSMSLGRSVRNEFLPVYFCQLS